MKNNTVIRFFIRLAAFLILLIAIDQLLGFTLKKLYFAQKVGQFSQTTFAVDSARADIMVFGSSRAVRHYATSILTDSLGLSSYNSGRDGQMIPYSTALLDVTLNRCTPKLIILDINPWELANNQSKYEKLSILLPYCATHPELIKYIKEISPYEQYKLYSQTYPYNSSLFILGSNALFPNSAKKDDRGYLPLTGQMTPAHLASYKAMMIERSVRTHLKKEVAEPKGIAYFKQFLSNTASHGVKTLVIISPTLLKNAFELDNQTLERTLVEYIAQTYPNVHFLDFSNDPEFNEHPEKFSDEFHLNKQASAEYTKKVVATIKAHHFLAN